MRPPNGPAPIASMSEISLMLPITRLLPVTFRAHPVRVGSYVDPADHTFKLWAGKLDNQHPVFERGARHVDSFRQHKDSLERARGNAAIHERALPVLRLAPAHDQLPVLECDAQLVAAEPGHRECDAKPAGRQSFDVAGRIGFACAFRSAFDKLFEMVEAQKKRAAEG